MFHPTLAVRIGSRLPTRSVNAAWLVLCALLLQWAGAEVRPIAPQQLADAVAQAWPEPAVVERASQGKAARLAPAADTQPVTNFAADAPLVPHAAQLAVLAPALPAAPCGTACLDLRRPGAHQPRAPPPLS